MIDSMKEFIQTFSYFKNTLIFFENNITKLTCKGIKTILKTNMDLVYQDWLA